MNKNIILYILILGVFGLALWLVIQQGILLETDKLQVLQSPTAKTNANPSIWADIWNNLHLPLSMLILQMSVIVLISRIFAFLSRKIGQPAVIGEIIAGIVLGPSLVGLFFPQAFAFLFPPESFRNLQFLSQIGLILFMFIIGMELDISILKRKAHEAVIISHASIIFPYFLGVILAYFLYQVYAPNHIGFVSFALFMGIAMSITAFPVLARIIQERGLTRTKLGAIAITCAAADDITAWCILATVIAIVKAGSIVNALITIALAFVYVLAMLYMVRPAIKKFAPSLANHGELNKPTVALIFLTLLLSAYVAEVIGIHALFGAFLAGVIMPHQLILKEALVEKIQDVSSVLLLPLFFVFTGLRTQIGLLNEWHLWVICLMVIVVAVVGKFAGSAVTARLLGQSWGEALSIGALMNTRGLMELIVLNIGYDLGILSPEIFAIMVLMALFTTFMTGPALDLINYCFVRTEEEMKVG